MEGNKQETKIRERQQEIDYQWFIYNFLIYWKWFVLSVAIFLAIGYLKVRYAVPVYEINSSIALKGRGISQNDDVGLFEAMGFIQASSNISNEIYTMRSRNMIHTVVTEEKFYIRYFVKGKIKDTEIYGYGNNFYNTAPVRAYVDSAVLASLNTTMVLTVSRSEYNKIQVEGYYNGYDIKGDYSSLPATVETPIGEVLLLPDPDTELDSRVPLNINITPPLWVAQNFMSNLSISDERGNSRKLNIKLTDTHPGRGVDFLNKLVEIYNRETINEKNESTKIALTFIEGRSREYEKDLYEAEDRVQFWREENDGLDVMSEVGFVQSGEYELERKLVEIESSYRKINAVESELRSDEYKQIITPIDGIVGALPELVRRYNDLVLERDKTRAYASDDIPLLKQMIIKLDNIREQLVLAIEGARQGLDTDKRKLQDVLGFYNTSGEILPSKQRDLGDVSRFQGLVAEMYTSMQTKKLDLELTMAVQASVVKILESPLSSGAFISPTPKMTYLMCIVFGIVIPFVILGIRAILNSKLTSESEVTRFSKVPIVISLPFIKKKESIIIKSGSTKPVIERFRLMRTNLQFVLGEDKKTILITSTLSGEGKTFVSLNLAMTFALRYKTLLVGLDVRRPKLNSYFNLPKNEGVVAYLLGEKTNVDELIYKNVNDTHMDVLVSGSIPPNPNELLMDKRLDQLFLELRKRYDYIVIDSSPVGSVSDAFLLKRISDVSLFIIRRNMTPKSALALLNDIHEKNRLDNLNIVLNAFSRKDVGYYGSGYGYGYGYGYSYGYGYGY
ncbi:MAG: polysaccharide biosynthesis tyrosine autokinase [Dysgonamonadaceae bacterium]|jgi:capsular exopolysaccharide synthesis family protein|nr:polysaccharide biosynthesis tyrosine autokinase [Dysgonamonadaceae bacterium]